VWEAGPTDGLEKGAGVLETPTQGGRLIPAPDRFMALSGPVMDTTPCGCLCKLGAGTGILGIDAHGCAITMVQSIEADTWWVGDTLVFPQYRWFVFFHSTHPPMLPLGTL
jgi:hypothetical protein